MRHPAVPLLCLLLCACAVAPEEPADTVAPLLTAKLTLRDLRRTDRALDARDPLLGSLMPLKFQPSEALQLQQALAERLMLTADSPPVAVDLNAFDVWRKADGTQTVKISFILRRGDTGTLHRVTRSANPGAGVTGLDAALVRDALREVIGTVVPDAAATTAP